MPRQRYIQDPVSLQLVPAEQYRGPSESTSAYIVPDIAPYQSMATGEMIQSRSQHREHLRRHGLVEIGNEIDTHMKQAGMTRQPQISPREREARRRQIADILSAKGIR